MTPARSQDKSELAAEQAIRDETSAQELIEQYADGVFVTAQTDDDAGSATLCVRARQLLLLRVCSRAADSATSAYFHRVAAIYECLRLFGDLLPQASVWPRAR